MVLVIFIISIPTDKLTIVPGFCFIIVCEAFFQDDGMALRPIVDAQEAFPAPSGICAGFELFFTQGKDVSKFVSRPFTATSAMPSTRSWT